jgi:DNA-binding transcriptional MocR family regulator
VPAGWSAGRTVRHRLTDIADDLERQIRAGDLTAGDRVRVRVRQVADDYEVAINTAEKRLAGWKRTATEGV